MRQRNIAILSKGTRFGHLWVGSIKYLIDFRFDWERVEGSETLLRDKAQSFVLQPPLAMMLTLTASGQDAVTPMQ